MPTTFPATKTGDASLVRPKFSPGLLLEDDDLTKGVDYARASHSLLLRAMLGCGVLCGLKVSVNRDTECQLTITVARGAALDCHGALVEVPCAVAPIIIDLGCAPPPWTTPLWVVLSRTERCCALRDGLCAANDDDDAASVATRVRDGYRIEVLDQEPAGACTAAHTCLDEGLCGCDCPDDEEHGRVLLARIPVPAAVVIGPVVVDHKVRRYIRPALQTDPLP